MSNTHDFDNSIWEILAEYRTCIGEADYGIRGTSYKNSNVAADWVYPSTL